MQKYGGFEGLLIRSHPFLVGPSDATPFVSAGEGTIAGRGEKRESGHSFAVKFF
jgi:hypothetical protein